MTVARQTAAARPRAAVKDNDLECPLAFTIPVTRARRTGRKRPRPGPL